MFYQLYYKVRWYAGIVGLLCVVIAVMKYSSWLDMKLGFKRPRAVSQQPVQPNPQSAPASQSSAAVPAVVTTDVRVQLSQANSLLSEASVYASEALKEVLSWQHDVEPLRDRVVGKTNAEASEESDGNKLIDRLAYVMRGERTTAKELSDASSRIESLRVRIDDLTKQSNPTELSASEMAEISQLHTTCKKANEDWQRAVRQALAIAHLLNEQQTPSVTPKKPATLGSKIKDADAKAAVADLEKQIKIAEEQKAQARAREAELKEQQRQKEKEEAELLAKATSPEVKALLAPFLVSRDVQPELSGAAIKFRRTADKKPMSLSAMYSINALTDSIDGLKRLAQLGGHRKLSPPKWSVHSQPNNWSDDDREMLKRAQQVLRDYGPILVKKGWLSD